MLASVLILLAGLVLTVVGADALVDGASSIARRSGVSEFIIGMTIVGFGTSCPELVVSLTGAIQGSADISLGNVIGSNIFNTLLILGLTAALAPVAITASNLNRDIPICFDVTAIFVAVGLLGGAVSRFDGILLLALFAAYMVFCFKTNEPDGTSDDSRTMGPVKAVIYAVAGIAALILGGRWFVGGAEDVAHAIGVSDKFIAVTVLAGGTSLPELATCIVAAAKKKGQLAMGNILGSNIFNILLITGLAAVVRPLEFSGIDEVDITALMVSLAIVWAGAYASRGTKIGRGTGAVLLAAEAAYFIWLIITI